MRLNHNSFVLDDFFLPFFRKRAPHPKEQRLHMRPHLWMTTVLAKYISGIILTIDLEESKDPGDNGLSNSMIRECIVSLAET